MMISKTKNHLFSIVLDPIILYLFTRINNFLYKNIKSKKIRYFVHIQSIIRVNI